MYKPSLRTLQMVFELHTDVSDQQLQTFFTICNYKHFNLLCQFFFLSLWLADKNEDL